MLNSIILHGRTAFVGELRIQNLTNNGTGEDFEKKTIDFRFAVPKSVAPVKTMKDGVEVTEVPTDFVYCQATGKIAEVIAEHCSDKKDGKIVSRELIIQGHLEGFEQNKQVEAKQKTKINGVIYEVPVSITVPVTVNKIVVERLDFCGPKPESAKPVTGTPVAVADDDIPEAKPVVEEPAPAKGKGKKGQTASQSETVITDSDITSTISDNAVSVPEGYNGEAAPF